MLNLYVDIESQKYREEIATKNFQFLMKLFLL